MPSTFCRIASVLAGFALSLPALPAHGQIIPPGPPAADSVSYADLVSLADSAVLVVRVQISKMTRVDDARSPSQPGTGRFYVQAKTRSLLTGQAALGEAVQYLVDLPLDARGKAPKLKKQDVFVFARPVPGRPAELQLISPRAQIAWSPEQEQRLRGVLQALVAPDAPGRVSGVRELMFVPGNLAGEGETQIFLNTSDGSAASITVRHQPGSPPRWGASFSELVAEPGNPPQRGTLAWYRLACFLPNTLPPRANVSETEAHRRQAASDYRMVLGELGQCGRTSR